MHDPQPGWQFWIDRGGTFTDIVARRPDGRLMQMGLVVDTVEEVANIGAGDIEPAPDFGTQVDTAYILGMAKVKGRVKTLLDINRVVTGQALDTLGAAMSLPSGTA